MEFCERRGFLVLLLGVGLAAAGFALVPRIVVDPRLEALLPPTTLQQAVGEAQERFAGAATMYLVAQSSDPELNRRLSREIHERVQDWPDTAWVIRRRDPTYFLDRRMLYLQASDLEELADQVEEVTDWERCSAIPGCVNLEDRPPDPEFATLRERYERNPELSALVGLLGAEALPDPEAPGPSEGNQEPAHDGASQTEELGELCARGGEVCVVQAALRGDPSDLGYATRMLRQGEQLLSELHPDDAPDDLRLVVAGRYRNLPRNVEAARQDLGVTAALGLGLVILVLLAQFRGVRALTLLLVPLAAGAGWTAGAIALLHPQLSLISAATIAVLAGLGIDFGLHIVTHYSARRQEGLEPNQATVATLSTLGPSLLGAAMTTGCGFAAITAAEFRGFAEMGALAAMGIGLTLVSTVLLFPPAVLLLHRVKREAGPLTRSWRRGDRPLELKPGRRLAVPIVALGCAALIGAATLAADIELEQNFNELQQQTVGHGTDFGAALHGTVRVATLMLANDPAALEAAASELRDSTDDQPQDGESWIITPRSFVPPDQEARLEQLARLREATEDIDEHASEDVREQIARWRPLLSVEAPIRVEDLPAWVSYSFAERDGTLGRLGFLYTDVSSWDARAMTRLAEQIGRWQERFPAVRFASAPAILGELNPSLEADAPLIVGLAILGLMLGTLLIGRSGWRTALVLVPVVLAVCTAVGLMVLLGWKVNLYNILVFPLAFGIGVDGAIYVVWSTWRARGEPLAWQDLGVSARAVLGSTLTSMAGFGALAQSANPGLSSLGKLAVLALALTLLANLVWLPAVLALMDRRRAAADP